MVHLLLINFLLLGSTYVCAYVPLHNFIQNNKLFITFQNCSVIVKLLCSFTLGRVSHTFHSSCSTLCGHMHATLLAMSSRTPMSSSSLFLMYSTGSPVDRLRPWLIPANAVASLTESLGANYNPMLHVTLVGK